MREKAVPPVSVDRPWFLHSQKRLLSIAPLFSTIPASLPRSSVSALARLSRMGRAGMAGSKGRMAAVYFTACGGTNDIAGSIKPHPFPVKGLFQSTPALWDGRFQALSTAEIAFIMVSIHARPLGRALLFVAAETIRLFLFQSTPALWDGRFGRTVPPTDTELAVSIHARPLGRALPTGCGKWVDDPDVSIHARPLGRALHRIYKSFIGMGFVSIHARPLGRALLSWLLDGIIYVLFQSTPALWDGRFISSTSSWTAVPCFNPRPPFGTGASL
ncbi:protein of unknown function [Trichlorobacter ammonificans]|uniref:Uncharacterized protein n=1 Tax=Trichlorobacter ammonificans TaxID=2916410 RepID=A0ABM9D6E4_9BACT|nr:protein of unknown function [Trichlorobacter ammonificans]